MAASTPFSQLVGPLKIYLAPASTAEPAVNATPGASWVELGSTTGEQTFAKDAANTYFYDNDHQGPVKGVTPQEDLTWTFVLANVTQAHFARVTSALGNITTSVGPPAVSRVPNSSGYIPTEYAILAKGDADSPFGNYPAQNYIPRGVFERTFELTRGKELRAELSCEFRALEDDTQTSGNKMGWSTAQTS